MHSVLAGEPVSGGGGGQVSVQRGLSLPQTYFAEQGTTTNLCKSALKLIRLVYDKKTRMCLGAVSH